LLKSILISKKKCMNCFKFSIKSYCVTTNFNNDLDSLFYTTDFKNCDYSASWVYSVFVGKTVFVKVISPCTLFCQIFPEGAGFFVNMFSATRLKLLFHRRMCCAYNSEILQSQVEI